MLNLICSIPENIGWAMVGFIAAFCVVLFAKLVGYGIEYVLTCQEEECEEV